MFQAAGHLGLFAGLYVCGAVVCLGQVAGLWDRPAAGVLVAVLLVATGAYALDRVKLRDAWLDPADAEAHPARYAFLRPRAALVRIGALACLVLGGIVGATVHPWAPLAAFLALVGVVAYAGRPRRLRPRIKDRLPFKNAYVAAGITGFAGLAAIAGSGGAVMPASASSWLALAGAAVVVFLRVLIDAALCDLDDETADRAHGTATLATTVGAARAWAWTGAARAAVPLVTLAAAWCPWRARLIWAALAVAGMAALRVRRPRRVRDFVDLRLPVEAAVATAILAWR